MIIWVYGTLRQWYRNYHFVRDQKFLGTDYVICYGMTYDNKDDYPVWCFLWSPVDKHILLYIELYDVDEHTLSVIDEMEWHPIAYMRTPVQTVSNLVVQMYHQDRAYGQFDEFLLMAEGENRYKWKPHR